MNLGLIAKLAVEFLTLPTKDNPLATQYNPYATRQALFPDGGYTTITAKKGLPTASSYQILTALIDKMLSNGFSEEDCKKFIGGNIYRVMKQVWR